MPRMEKKQSVATSLALTVIGISVFSAGATAGLSWLQLAQPDGVNTLALRDTLIVNAALVALCTGVVGFFLARQFGGPIERIEAATHQLVRGEGSIKLAEEQRTDSFGVIAENLRTLSKQQAEKQSGDQARDELLDSLSLSMERMADGQFQHRLEGVFEPPFAMLKTHFNATAEAMEGVLGAVSSHAHQIKLSAENVRLSAADLSQRTENQAATLEETSAAIEQLTANVASTAKGAKHTDQLVGSAKSNAESSGAVMDQAVEAMKRIEDSSSQISQVVGVIDDIAFQTNLLALNASVEAARAGDAGRGFTVVASEVRALAQRSSDAAKKIEGLMTESQRHVGHGVEHVNMAVDTLRSIAGSVTEISEAVTDIATTAQEQSISISEINSAISNLDQVTQKNAAMVAESTTAGQKLKSDADELEQFLGRFGWKDRAQILEPAGTQHEPVHNPVAEQQESLVKRLGVEGNTAVKFDEYDAEDWIEF